MHLPASGVIGIEKTNGLEIRASTKYSLAFF